MRDLYVPKHLALQTSKTGYGVFASKRIKKGGVVCEVYFDSIRPRRAATRKSIQVWEDAFFNNSLETIDDYFNHSCDPNAFLQFSNYVLRALREIDAGKEITWNYLTTEFDLAADDQDFECMCISDKCVGHVKGFKFLTEEQKWRLLPQLSTYLRTKMFDIEFPSVQSDGTMNFA